MVFIDRNFENREPVNFENAQSENAILRNLQYKLYLQWLTTLPTEVMLGQNFPNPFNPTTRIPFTLQESVEVTLDVFDITGRRVATLVNGFHTAGTHTASFDGAGLSSGIYVYRLTAGSRVETRAMTLIK